jgi:hypothetical protein
MNSKEGNPWWELSISINFGELECWRVGFVLSLRVTGSELRVMHCSV